METTIGFVGLGAMGGLMARRLAGAGFALSAVDKPTQAVATLV